MIITINPKPNQGFYEVCKLPKRKDRRGYVQGVKITQGLCYGTDGRVLARCQAPVGLDDGFYVVVGLTMAKAELVKADDVDYPDVSRVFDLDGTTDVTLSSMVGVILYHIALEVGTALNPEALAHVPRNIDDLERITAVPGGKHPVQFDFVGGWSLAVMPIAFGGGQ